MLDYKRSVKKSKFSVWKLTGSDRNPATSRRCAQGIAEGIALTDDIRRDSSNGKGTLEAGRRGRPLIEAVRIDDHRNRADATTPQRAQRSHPDRPGGGGHDDNGGAACEEVLFERQNVLDGEGATRLKDGEALQEFGELAQAAIGLDNLTFDAVGDEADGAVLLQKVLPQRGSDGDGVFLG